MTTIRDEPGHIAASNPRRTSYKPAFLRCAITEEKFGPLVHSVQVIENKRRIEMRVEQVYRQSRESLPYPLNTLKFLALFEIRW